jgi:putative oxidoreductase
MVTATLQPNQRSAKALLATVVRTRTADLPANAALIACRIALAWIFIYYGAGKLFGAFNGPGIHNTAIYFSQSAHLHPGGFFAVLGGLTEFGGGVLVAIGLGTRLAGIALFGDMVMAMITVTWSTGINPISTTPAEIAQRIGPGPGYQLNLAVAVLAIVMAIYGAGRFSLDALIERRVAGTNTAQLT